MVGHKILCDDCGAQSRTQELDDPGERTIVHTFCPMCVEVTEHSVDVSSTTWTVVFLIDGVANWFDTGEEFFSPLPAVTPVTVRADSADRAREIASQRFDEHPPTRRDYEINSELLRPDFEDVQWDPIPFSERVVVARPTSELPSSDVSWSTYREFGT